MEYLIVGIGGLLGSLARYSLGRLISHKLPTSFPAATFIINITGALLLGVINSFGFKGGPSLLIADGFLGAYTTFSTFMYEGFNLFKNRKGLNAAVYIAGSLVFGVTAYFAGFKLGRLI